MKLAYCTECGTGLSLKSGTQYTCTNGHSYWNNPRAAVALVLEKGGQILFARRANEPQRGKLDLPGGFVDPNESLELAVIREAKEELGIDINPQDLAYIASSPNNYLENIYTCDAIFMVSKWQGETIAADDVASVEWHPLTALISDEFAWESWKQFYPNIEQHLSSVNKL